MQFRSRALVVAAFGLGPLLLAAGCGSGSGAGAREPLVPIQPSSYVTMVPATTTTTTTIAAGEGGEAGGVSPTEQTYTVVAGDSISKIASLFDISMDALVNYNNWEDGTSHFLGVGDVVKIPPNARIPGSGGGSSSGGETGDTGDTGDTAETGDSAETGDDGETGAGCTHTIVAGENPSKVAAKYDITYDQLQAANPGIDFTTTFVVGHVLTIPPEGDCG